MISIFGAERAESIMASMAEVGREEGITLAYKEGSRSPNTMSAHVLSQFALAEGKQAPMSEALFKAFFTSDSRNFFFSLSQKLVYTVPNRRGKVSTAGCKRYVERKLSVM